MIQVKRNQTDITAVNPLSASNMSKAVMGEEQITLVWEAAAFTQLNIGDYIVVEGANWTLNRMPTVKKLSAKLWQYNAVFQSTKYDLAKAMFMLQTGALLSGEFSMVGTADTFMDLLISNLNRVAGSALWSKGQVIAGTDYKTLTFTNEDCLSVLSRLAEEFDTEYSISNRVINLKKISTVRTVTLTYGATLYDIERTSVDSSDLITRLYAFGSKKNLPANYRGGNSPLRLPEEFNGYLESNVNLYGLIEGSKTFEEIYPRLASGGAGTVTAVGNEFTFTDANLDFDVNSYMLDGTTAKVRFNSGPCAGYDFEIQSFNSTTKTFVLIANKSENDFILPTAAIKPAVGNKYVLIDIAMPQSYISAAEAELEDKATYYLSENSTPKVSYRATFSALYAKANLQSIECGDTVTVTDTDLNINEPIRIVKLQKGLADFWNVQFDLANTVTTTRIERIEGSVASVQNTVVVTNDRINRDNLRAYRNTKELREMVFDPDGYFDPTNIKPLSIETSMLSVGSKSQSLQLSSILQPNYTNNPQLLYWSAGVLTHFTIEDNAVKVWSLASGTITITGANQTTALYIYARCARTGSTGDIYLSSAAVKFDSDATNWFFLIGVLHSPNSGVRGISLTYGMTTINGQFIRTGVISSTDGATWFNLNTGEFRGNFTFRNGDSVADAVQNAYDYADTANAAAQEALNEIQNTNAFINSVTAGLQSQIDGNITSWFYGYVPTTANVPASNWSTDTLRNNHLGDLFYDTTTGKAYRFQLVAGVYSWAMITDTDITKALADAAAAKDTADGKRRVFVAQPTTPYDVGDLWVQGTAGDIMRCSVARATGAYTASDWVKASKYTDDTAANAAQATANAAQSSAATALSKLTDIADDNKLTPGEKQMVKKEWDIIAAEYQKVCDYADIYGQSYDAYTDAYYALSSYITPKLADLTTNSDITPGYQFRLVFQEYYGARQDIYNSVAIAAKSYTDNSIASIYVGGENMILNHRQTLAAGSNNYFYSLLYGAEYSHATAILGSISSDNLLTASEKTTVKAEWDAIAYQYLKVMAYARINGAISTSYAAAYATLEAYITPLLANMSVDSYISGSTFRSYFDSYYTARQALLVASSAYLKNATPYVFSIGSSALVQGSATTLTLRLYDFMTGNAVNLTAVPISANRQIFKFTTPSSGNWSLIIYAGVIESTAGNTVNLSQLMLQTGDKATAFSPAVRHVTDAMQGTTDITGGLVATNLLMMKDAAGNIRGGLSGLQDDNVGMWTGGSYSDALADIAKIILKKDGAGQLAGGKINWDAAGAMNVGLFNIFSNLLSSGNISFTSDALENLAAIGGSITTSPGTGSTSAASYNSYTASLSSAQFTLTKNSLVKFRVPRSLTIVASDYATCNIYVKNSANVTVYASNRDKTATSNSSNNYDYAVNLQAGTYYVAVEIKLNGTNSGNSQTVSITGYNGVGTSISIEPISTLTKIANNGMYSYWGASAYMYLRTDYGFEVRFGNYGIQITTAGLKKMTDGVNWVTL